MTWAQRVADHVGGETVVAAALFQRRGTAAGAVGDTLSIGIDPEREAPGFPSNTILAATDTPTLYAFHRDPTDGLIGRWPLDHVGARLDAAGSDLNRLDIVAFWELRLSFPDCASAAFECAKRSDEATATYNVIAAGACDLAANLPRPRSLDPDFTDWDPDDLDTWDERIVMVADDEDFAEWQREWLADNGRG